MSALVRITTEAAGANCAAGGVAIMTGLDLDKNGTLDASEVRATQYVCNAPPSDGHDGHNSLVVVSDAAASAACPAGGKQIATGVDDDDDGTLAAAEIDHTDLVCNGANGSSGHTALADAAQDAGEHCATGGKALRVGVDLNDNGTLDGNEVTSTQYVCNGAKGADGKAGADGHAGLVLITDIEGEPCAATGKEITSGVDADDSGTLEGDEITGTEYVCDGAAGTPGANGHQSLVTVADAAGDAHSPCTTGGQRITTGLDLNDNQTLEDGEVAGAHYVCNGTAASGAGGASSLISFDPVYPNVMCPNGGKVLAFGLDDDKNGALDASEVDGSGTFCAGDCGTFTCGGNCGACDGTLADNCYHGACACGTGPACEGDDACIAGVCDPWMPALATFGPISSLQLSNVTLTERVAELYQFDTSGVFPGVESTKLRAVFTSGTVTWHNGTDSGEVTSHVGQVIPLAHGDNTVTLVHDLAGVSTIYTLHIRRGGLFTSFVVKTDGVVMTPSLFDPTVHEYTLSDVPYETATIDYQVASTFDTAGYLECNHCDWWQYASRGTQPMWLSPGVNRIGWRFVPGVAGVPDEWYYINVKRGLAFGAAHLGSLTLSNATVTEVAGQIYQFSATGVASSVASTDLTVTFTTGTASWTNAGQSGPLTSGVPATVPLDYGDQQIKVTHTVGGVDTVYTVAMRRAGQFTSFVIKTPGVTMTPAFDPAVHEYTLSDIGYAQTTIDYIVATTFDTAGFLECSQCDWWQYESRGVQQMTLHAGVNRIDWTLHAGVDGVPNDHYYVTVTRGPPFDATHLSALTFSNATLTETAGQLYQFSASGVAQAVDATGVTATFGAGSATWSCGAASGALTSGIQASVPLAYGDNTIKVTHTSGAQVTTYTIVMRRAGIMTGLVFTTPGVTMSPAFNTATHVYTLSDVPYETTTLSYKVWSTFDTAGYLECSQCDWWQYESRGEQSLNLAPGANCINWRFSPGVSGVPDEHYYVKVNRGPVTDAPACP